MAARLVPSGEGSAQYPKVKERLRRAVKKSLGLFGAIAVGVLFPQGHGYACLIRYCLMLILFLALLDLTIERKTALNPRLTPILAMMLAISGVAAWIGHFVSPQLSAVAFVLAMAPTATAAPVMTQFLAGRVQYVMAAVVVTNSFSALVLPFVLPILAPEAAIAFNLQGLLLTGV